MKIKNKKGFTLVECVMALVLFAIMTVIVSGILSISLKKYKENNNNRDNLNLQEKDFAEDNSSVKEVSKINKLEIPFDGVTIEVENVSNKASDSTTNLQLNKLEATIEKESNGGGGGGGGPKPDIKTTSPHLYGSKALTKVYIKSESTLDSTIDVYETALEIKVTDSLNLLATAGNSIKVVLPKGAYGVEVQMTGGGRYDYTTDDYDELDTEKDSTHIRFTQCAGTQPIKVKYKITKTDYENNYGSFYKYFVDKDSTDTSTNTVSFIDTVLGKNTGYYNTPTV